MKEWKGVPMKEIVNDKEWQTLRKSFEGTWKNNPKENVKKLRAYLNVDPDDSFRWVRVFNYLTGTAFRIGVISHPEITKLRTEVKVKLEYFRKIEKERVGK